MKKRAQSGFHPEYSPAIVAGFSAFSVPKSFQSWPGGEVVVICKRHGINSGRAQSCLVVEGQDPRRLPMNSIIYALTPCGYPFLIWSR